MWFLATASQRYNNLHLEDHLVHKFTIYRKTPILVAAKAPKPVTSDCSIMGISSISSAKSLGAIHSFFLHNDIKYQRANNWQKTQPRYRCYNIFDDDKWTNPFILGCSMSSKSFQTQASCLTFGIKNWHKNKLSENWRWIFQEKPSKSHKFDETPRFDTFNAGFGITFDEKVSKLRWWAQTNWCHVGKKPML